MQENENETPSHTKNESQRQCRKDPQTDNKRLIHWLIDGLIHSFIAKTIIAGNWYGKHQLPLNSEQTSTINKHQITTTDTQNHLERWKKKHPISGFVFPTFFCIDTQNKVRNNKPKQHKKSLRLTSHGNTTTTQNASHKKQNETKQTKPRL